MAVHQDHSGENQPTPSRRRQKDYASRVVWAAILITIGIIFLLNNFGVISWSIWLTLIQLWPILLVILGLKLLLGRSAAGQIIAVIISLILLGVGLAYALAISTPSLHGYWLGNMPWMASENDQRNTQELRVAIDDGQQITRRVMRLDIPAAQLAITDSSDERNHLHVQTFRIQDDALPTLETSFRNNQLNITLNGSRQNWWVMHRSMGEIRADIGAPPLPTDLNVQLGAGEATIDLDQVALREAAFDIGAGKATVRLTKNALPEKLTIKLGAGQAVLELPEHVNVVSDYEVGVGQITIDGTNLRGNGTYQTDDDSTQTAIELVSTIGAGNLTIKRVQE